MRSDKFNNVIFENDDILELLYNNEFDKLKYITTTINEEISQLEEYLGFSFKKEIDYTCSMEEFDKNNQDKWFIPDEYKIFDVKEFCLNKCLTQIEIDRVNNEFIDYHRLNMIPVLQWLKYFVDTCIDNDILWGVGRGSSVASYVLYLIGLHKINSIKYDLDYKEFLRK